MTAAEKINITSNLGQQIVSNMLMAQRAQQSQQELSLRARAFEAEQEWNQKRYPLMLKQLENQTTALDLEANSQKLQIELQRVNMAKSNAELKSTAAIAPIAAEMDFLARTSPESLMSYSIPDITIEGDDKTVADAASALAKSKLNEYKTSLLNNNKIVQTWNDTADKLLQVSERYDTPSVMKMELQDAARKLRSSGLSGLTDHEKQNLIPYAEKIAYASSPAYIEMQKQRVETAATGTKAVTGRIKELREIAGNIFVDDATRKAAAAQLNKVMLSGQDQLESDQEDTSVTPSAQAKPTASATPNVTPSASGTADLKTKFKQVADAIKQQHDPLPLINMLSDEVLKFKNLKPTKENKEAASKEVLRQLRNGGVSLPFLPSDLNPSSQEEN